MSFLETARSMKSKIPSPIWNAGSKVFQKWCRLTSKKRMLNHYAQNPEEQAKYETEFNNIAKRGAAMFNYDYAWNSKNVEIKVEFDEQKNLHYINHSYDNEKEKIKRLYFPREYKVPQIKEHYKIEKYYEQHEDSPHRYLTPEIMQKGITTFYDVGGSDAFLALDLVEEVKRIIIFEIDEKWMGPLHATFEPWQEKVTIINKYVSDQKSEQEMMLDEIDINPEDTILIKMDVEGSELRVLNGAKKYFEAENVIFIVCTYHRDEDEEEFGQLFRDSGFQTEFSKGYILPIWEYIPTFRKGLIRAWKN